MTAQALVMHPGGGSAYAHSYKPQKIVECVPLNSEILTTSGWKKHDEVAAGETVLGFNPATNRCEWTTLRAVNVYDDQEVVTYGNRQWQVKCTRNHRWAMDYEMRCGRRAASPYKSQQVGYRKHQTVLCSIEDAKERSRIIQAAPGPDGAGFAWNDRREIIGRSDAVSTVLRMTSEQRKAFIVGMMYGEGTIVDHPIGCSLIFTQRPGPIMDAFKLACFFEGIATSSSSRTTKKINGDDKVCARCTMLSKPMRVVDKSIEFDSETADVWCPTTDLGTWVMRQGDLITITGNSFQGGEKPAVLLIGHYHKLSFNVIRSVYAIQTGTQQDQTAFMRKKGIDAHVGGGICWLHQDAETGAIDRCRVEFFTYYNRGYYQNRWSHSGEATLPDRGVKKG